jgi:hypothetical protein
MALYFDKKGWIVVREDGIGNGGFLMYATDSAITPDRIKAKWRVAKARQPAPSLRVRKLGGRESILELSGIPSKHLVSYCMGRYTREVCSHNDKPAYRGSRQAEPMGIWFCGGAWRVGLKENKGTELCFISVVECARTPDAVQSMWRAESRAELDKRVRVVGASAQQSSSATVHETQQLSSAPPKLAVIGMEGDSYDGIYTKQLREVGKKVVYEGGGNGKQAIWCFQLPGHMATWVVGDAEDIGTGRNVMHTQSPAITPDAVTGPWRVPLMVPCTSIRVSKSKKKHTKVIEVKGAHKDGDANPDLALMNGKYRQSCMVGGRPMFKGGQDGRAALWFDERHGKWRGGPQNRIGTGICIMEATDLAAAPNAVKAPWYAHYNTFKPSPYPNVIVPSVKAAEREVPRLMQLKMSELVVAQHMRCLGCGHEYTAHAEVVFQVVCMHHHCVCCGEEHGGDVCTVCAEEGGK